MRAKEPLFDYIHPDLNYSIENGDCLKVLKKIIHFLCLTLCQRAKPDQVDQLQDLAFDPVTKYILDLIQTGFLDRIGT